jgi:branched-chain amino acid transport system ATP-binding protein
LIEQNANAALKIADRGYVMETGRIVLEESAKALMSNQEVKRAYLGKDQKEIWE